MNGDGTAEILLGGTVLTEDSEKSPKIHLVLDASNNQCDSFALTLSESDIGPTVVTPKALYQSDGTKKFDIKKPTPYIASADVFKDVPGLELVQSGGAVMRVLNGQTGEVIVEQDLNSIDSIKCPSGKVGGGPVTLGDFDGNKETTEIAMATGRYFTIFNSEGELLSQSLTKDCSSLVTGVSSFDFNGDTKPELLYADEEYFRIYELKDNELQIVYETANPSGTILEYPVVVDVNGNGSAEVLVVSNNYNVSGLYKLDGQEEDKKAAESITGIRAFSPRNA